MTRWLSEQSERGLADGDRRDPSAELRAQLSAGRGAALDQPGEPSAGAERSGDFEDLARLGAYLDGQLSDPEREALLRALSTSPRQSADLVSAAALVAALDTASEQVPAELLAQARSAFGTRPNQRWNLRILFDRRPAVGFSLAAVVLLISLPIGLLLLDGRMNWPLGLSPSRSDNGPASSFDALTPGVPPAAPKPARQSDAEAGTRVRQSSDSPRSEQDSCETAISGTTDADRAAMPAEKTTPSALQRLPCSRSSSKSLDTGGREIRSPPTASAPGSGVPAPSAILPVR